MTTGADATTLSAWVEALARPSDCTSDADRIERIRQFEVLKSAVAAAQARETAAFVDSQRAQQRSEGVQGDRVGRGIAAQVALARRISPHQAQRYVGWAKILTTELPATFAALQEGRTSEWRALIVARETIWLSREDRAQVDDELAPRLEGLGDRRVESEAKRIAYRLDPQGFLERSRAAERDRRVSLRPAPDVMARLTALLPAAQGVACLAALRAAADSALGAGDVRTRGQVMADTLVEQVTGQARARAVPVEVNLIMSDEALLAGGDEPAHLDGYGAVPAGWARDLVLRAGHGTPIWLRRLFVRPGTGELAALESRRRTFTGNQRLFVRLHDLWCRTPWCEAPIRHIDHVRPAAHGGATHVHNAQGTCVACNHAKQAPGWVTEVEPGRRIRIVTPTGHFYRSRAPSLVEQQVVRLLAAS